MFSDSDFARLLEHLDRPWSGFRKVRKGVKKRVRRHMTALGCTTIEHYLVRLDRRAADRMDCERCLRVTISRFFRDQLLWQSLQATIIPDLAGRFGSPLRVWSAGCAGGEEAYSLAVVWHGAAIPARLHLVASDADADSLLRARAGVYAQGSLKEVPPDVRAAYFDAERGGRRFVIRRDRLPPIRWQAHDLLGAPPEKDPFHLILLRNNLLTYYRGSALQAAFSRILSVLKPGGALVVGARERLPDRCAHPLIRDADCPWVYWRREESR